MKHPSCTFAFIFQYQQVKTPSHSSFSTQQTADSLIGLVLFLSLGPGGASVARLNRAAGINICIFSIAFGK